MTKNADGSKTSYQAYCSALLMDSNTEPPYRALGAFVVALHHKTHEKLAITVEGSQKYDSASKNPLGLRVSPIMTPLTVATETILMCLEDAKTGGFLTITVEIAINSSNVSQFLIELNELASYRVNIKNYPYTEELSGVFLSPKGILVKNIEQAVWTLAGEDPIRFGSKLAETVVTCGLYHLNRTAGSEYVCNKCASQLVCLSKLDNNVKS
jgi:hypothetical protein